MGDPPALRLDVIGDVHGHLETLTALLDDLGYREGRHPEGRRLVFLGDLIDRGPHSLEVAELAREYSERHGHLCLLGNHELNLVEWWRGRMGPRHSNRPTIAAVEAAPERWRPVLEFFETLPVALELPDLRVTHAVWHRDALRAVAPALETPVELSHAAQGPWRDRVRLHAPYEGGAHRAGLPRDALAGQSEPALEVFLKGHEIEAELPFEDNDGRRRTRERARWWRAGEPEVDTDRRVVFGHYWNLPPIPGRHEAFTPPHPSGHPALRAWAEAHHRHVAEAGRAAVPSAVRAVCVDYNGVNNAGARSCVGAYRYPEAEVVWRTRGLEAPRRGHERT